MLPDPKLRCPAVGFARSCREILAEHDCPKFVRLTGRNPSTGAIEDKTGCVDSFLPLLMLENSQQQRQTAAAIESTRNALVQIRGAELEHLRAIEAMAAGSVTLIEQKAVL
jgi:hypothetical protein